MHSDTFALNIRKHMDIKVREGHQKKQKANAIN